MTGGHTETIYLVGFLHGGPTDADEYIRQLQAVSRLEAVITWPYWRTKKPRH